MRSSQGAVLGILAAAVLTLGACGGDDETTTATTSSTTASTTTATSGATGAEGSDSLETIGSAVEEAGFTISSVTPKGNPEPLGAILAEGNDIPPGSTVSIEEYPSEEVASKVVDAFEATGFSAEADGVIVYAALAEATEADLDEVVSAAQS